MGSGSFEGKVAIVTGGSSGIGFGTATYLIERGATVILWDINPETLARSVEKASPDFSSVVDVTSEESVRAATAAAEERHGRLDILVNCAGIPGNQAVIDEYRLDDWQHCVAVNLTGTFLCCKHAVPLMRRHDYGRIVNLSSMSARQGTPRSPAYSAAKAGVIGLTNAVGRELVDTNIRINCIAPSAIETEFFQIVPKARLDAARALIPLGRLGRVEEAAAMIAFLASEECSFSTGAVFDLSGGRAAI